MPGNINFYTALLGFREMGFECVLYRTMEELADSSREDVVVGGLGPVRNALVRHGVTIEELDYPAELQPYMGRKVWSATVDEVASDRSLWPVFVKSAENKRLTGKVVSSDQDLAGLGMFGRDLPVTCSEVVDFTAEWRCFVRYGQILDVRPYKGDWKKSFEPTVIENAVKDFASAPRRLRRRFRRNPRRPHAARRDQRRLFPRLLRASAQPVRTAPVRPMGRACRPRR